MTFAHVLVDAAQRAAVDLADAQRALASAKTRAAFEAATAAVAAATAALHAARAVVSRALETGRLASAAHVVELPNDCLGDIFARLPPRDVAAAAATCRALRDAVRAVDPHRGAVTFPATPISMNAAATLTALTLSLTTKDNTIPPLPFLPRLASLIIHAFPAGRETRAPTVTSAQPRLICPSVAPALSTFVLHEPASLHGIGDAVIGDRKLWVSLAGVTRVILHPERVITFGEHGGEQQLTCLEPTLSTLRRLEIATQRHVAWVDVLDARADAGRRPALTMADVSMKLPPMPALTRLRCSDGARMASPGEDSHMPPGLQVLDLRGLTAPIVTDEAIQVATRDNEGFAVALASTLTDDPPTELRTPFVLPPIAAALMPALHTLLIGFAGPPGAFNLWDLVRAPSALRLLVLINCRLRCQPPPDAPATASAADCLRSNLPLLSSVHIHGCITGGSTADAAREWYRALQRHAPRVCAVGAGDSTCMICSLIDAE